MKIYNIKQAEEWFLAHSSGKVICVKDGEEKEVGSYPDAVEFLTKLEK